MPGGTQTTPETPTQAAAPSSRPALPTGVAFLLLLGLTAVSVVLWYWLRRAALRAWRTYARRIGGELRERNAFSPAVLAGTLKERPFLMETATSHEDDAPYYHTRAALPIRNSAGFILGLRRKSLLEEAQTRKEAAAFDLQDPDFERRFFLVSNDGSRLPDLLTKEVRRELARYSDVEIYVRLSEVEWRRAGEQSDLKAIERLNALLAEMAEAIDALPSRPKSLSQRLADEALIAKGV